ncbi:MAG: DUF748 domain-containing protein, partial [Cytophagales bacterium]|nr:DUF748 domain-containing protein [Cytophagales bacterium]
NIQSTGKRWDSDTLGADFSFESGIGSGKMKGNFAINFEDLHYRFDVQVKEYSLGIIEQYLKDLANYGSFSATLDAKMKANGSFVDQDDISLTGQLAINEFHFGKNPKEDYAAFEKLEISIREMNPEFKIFKFDSVALRKPFFKYERYDHLDNLETMFGRKGANLQAANSDATTFNLVIEIAKYVKVMAKSFLKSSYQVDRLAVYDGNLKFNDYSINEKFSVALNPLFIRADSINKKNPRVHVFLKSGIKPFGNASVALSINPQDSSNFDLNYRFDALPVSMFNPYIISYTSFPLDRGSLDLYGTWHVRNGNITSDNRLRITDPRLSKKIKNDNTRWLPMPLIMTIVRERGNVIDYTIPISGDLKNPKFHVIDVIVDLLANIFVKPLSMPYRLNLKSIKSEIEKSLSIHWRMRSSTLLPSQERFVGKMAVFLKKHPEATITIYPKQYMAKEKEYILFFEAKKKYFLTNHRDKGQQFEEEDAEDVDHMSIKDTLFIHHLDKQLHDPLLFTIQEKCARYVDTNRVNAVYAQLSAQREQQFTSYFEKKGVAQQVKMVEGKNIVPFNGFSFYRISYAGDFPPDLIKAYDKMVELNDDAPRERFQEAKAKGN